MVAEETFSPERSMMSLEPTGSAVSIYVSMTARRMRFLRSDKSMTVTSFMLFGPANPALCKFSA
jgi:hypothetical protein